MTFILFEYTMGFCKRSTEDRAKVCFSPIPTPEWSPSSRRTPSTGDPNPAAGKGPDARNPERPTTVAGKPTA